MTRFIVGPDGTRYKVIPNALPDPQDYGWLEPVAGEGDTTTNLPGDATAGAGGACGKHGVYDGMVCPKCATGKETQ